MPRGGYRPNAGRPKGKGRIRKDAAEIKKELFGTADPLAAGQAPPLPMAPMPPEPPPGEEMTPAPERKTGHAGYRMSPLEFLVRTYRDSKKLMADRIQAAKAAAPYIHPRQPQAIHVSGGLKLQRVEIKVLGFAEMPPAPETPQLHAGPPPEDAPHDAPG